MNPEPTTRPPDPPAVMQYARPAVLTPRQEFLRSVCRVFAAVAVICALIAPLILCPLNEDPFAYIALACALGAVIVGVKAGRDSKGRRASGRGLDAAIAVLVGLGSVMAAQWVISPPGRTRAVAYRSMCQANLRSVHAASEMYRANFRAAAPDVAALVSAKFLSPSTVKCPAAASGRTCDYLFVPPTGTQASGVLVGCDLAGNHGGDGQTVVFADGRGKWVGEAEFQALLARPPNAEFAAALKTAEAGATPK